MGLAYDIDPWNRPAVGARAGATPYGMAREEPGPRADLSFDDLIDILNPLQHVPVLSSIYRWLTGDEISPHARIMGGTLYGGPIGFVAASHLVLMDEAAGGDVGGQVVTALFGSEESAGAIAAAPPAPAQLEAPLSGQTALAAFAADLASLEAAGGPPPASAPVATAPDAAPDAAPDVAARILYGLDKYEAARSEKNADSVRERPLDRRI